MGTPGLSLENQGVRWVERIDREPQMQTVSKIQTIRRRGRREPYRVIARKGSRFPNLTPPSGSGEPPAEDAVAFSTGP